MSNLVVSPSVRAFPPEYYDSVRDADILIVDDSDGKADRSGLTITQLPHLIYADTKFQNKYLGDHPVKEIIPHHNPSCKDFGLWYAWKEKYDVVILLDDDCDTRITPNFIDQIPIGKPVQAASYSGIRSGWVNTIHTLGYPFYARGIPYEYRDETHITDRPERVIPAFNEGLWCGTPDINGIDKINIDPEFMYPEKLLVHEDTKPLFPYTYLKTGQHLPLSIMNVQLKTELIPAFYQPPDWDMPNGFKIRRHDDVWSAYFLKTIMDITGDIMTFGVPMIYHRKAGNAIKETLSEHYTNLIQTWFTRAIDFSATKIAKVGTDYASLAHQLASYCWAVNHNIGTPGVFSYALADYFDRCKLWADHCDSVR